MMAPGMLSKISKPMQATEGRDSSYPTRGEQGGIAHPGENQTWNSSLRVLLGLRPI
jgi:hypothetical protein